MDEELARLDAEIARFAESADASARARLASVAIAKGKLLADELDRPEDAIEAFAIALAASLGDPAAVLKDCAIEALFHQSQALFEAGRADDALAAMDDLLRRFGEEVDPPLRFSVCHALYVTIFTLRWDKLGRDETILALSDEVIARFGGDAERLVRDRVLHTMISKSFALENLGRRDDGVALRNVFWLRFRDEQDPDIRAHAARVVQAMDRRFGVADAEKRENLGRD